MFPTCSSRKPRTSVPNCGSTVLVLSVAKLKAKMVSSPPVKLPISSRRRSISGFSRTSSTITNAANRKNAAANSASISGESNQSSRCPWPSAAVSIEAASASSTMPR